MVLHHVTLKHDNCIPFHKQDTVCSLRRQTEELPPLHVRDTRSSTQSLAMTQRIAPSSVKLGDAEVAISCLIPVPGILDTRPPCTYRRDASKDVVGVEKEFPHIGHKTQAWFLHPRKALVWSSGHRISGTIDHIVVRSENVGKCSFVGKCCCHRYNFFTSRWCTSLHGLSIGFL